MKGKLKVMTIFGTRPEAIKMIPVILELQKHSHLIEVLVAITAQHREMLDQVLDAFQLVPDYDLNLMKENQSLVMLTTHMLEKLDQVLTEVKPNLVLVHGDTTTTLVSSLAAFYHQIPVGHVEAGLRTGNKLAPYPEEINRQLAGVLADFHFAPTEEAANNLRREGKNNDIYVTGNTAIDALFHTVTDNYEHPVLEQIGKDRFLLLTAHRRENWGEPLENILLAVKKLVNENEDLHVVYPVHLNPMVKELAKKRLGEHPRIHLMTPLEVMDFHNLMERAYFILTDSGGIQEEASALGKPVLVLRDTTERPEGVDAGVLKLVGTSTGQIVKEGNRLLTDEAAYDKMAKPANPYGDGQASKRIVKILLNYFQGEEELIKTEVSL